MQIFVGLRYSFLHKHLRLSNTPITPEFSTQTRKFTLYGVRASFSKHPETSIKAMTTTARSNKTVSATGRNLTFDFVLLPFTFRTDRTASSNIMQNKPNLESHRTANQHQAEQSEVPARRDFSKIFHIFPHFCQKFPKISKNFSFSPPLTPPIPPRLPHSHNLFMQNKPNFNSCLIKEWLLLAGCVLRTDLVAISSWKGFKNLKTAKGTENGKTQSFKYNSCCNSDGTCSFYRSISSRCSADDPMG